MGQEQDIGGEGKSHGVVMILIYTGQEKAKKLVAQRSRQVNERVDGITERECQMYETTELISTRGNKEVGKGDKKRLEDPGKKKAKD
jgi:hypothetical protein